MDRHFVESIGAKRRERPGRADDVLIAHQPIVGMLQHDAERAVGEMLSGDCASPRWTARGVRYYLPEPEGDGYWDFFQPSSALMVSVTDASYHKDTWVRVEGSGFFKLRILLSGCLRTRSGVISAQAPESLFSLPPGASTEGF